MRDFGDVRQAARQAVESLRQRPVMAEDFGAQPHSSQTACLEGVRASNVHVGIYGERYGFIAQSGLSATEEEFQEARRRGLPVLCFERKGIKEPAQQAFLDRIKAYESGYAFAFFETPEELKLLVVKGVHDLIGQAGVSTIDGAAAKSHADAHEWTGHPSSRSETWLGCILFPARQGENYLDILDLGRGEVQDRLLQPALFGPGTVFRRELGIQKEEGEGHLAFFQLADRAHRAAHLAIHADGTLTYDVALGRARSRSGGFSLTQMYVIDEDEVKALLTAFLTYAQQFYGQLERGPVITSLLARTRITGLHSKSFGRLPSADVSSMTVPMKAIDDPLRVPKDPLKVSRAELSDAASLGGKLTELIARAFRAAGLSYGER